MMTSKKDHRKIRKARAEQIINNVAEEFSDHRETNFATKNELCRVILYLREVHWQELQRKDRFLDDIVGAAICGSLNVKFELGNVIKIPPEGQTAHREELLTKILGLASEGRSYAHA